MGIYSQFRKVELAKKMMVYGDQEPQSNPKEQRFASFE